MEVPEEFTKIESIFVRHRNALVLRGQFTPIYTDYYLHLMQHGIRHPAELDQMLKDSMAVLALHLIARPWDETIAWTVNLRAPRINLFVTGRSSRKPSPAGSSPRMSASRTGIFSIPKLPPAHREPRTSSWRSLARTLSHGFPNICDQSEQRPARAFRLADENFALVTAQPDCDLAWLTPLDDAAVPNIDPAEETKLLETRRFRFYCGCTLDQIVPVLGGWRGRLDQLFGDSDSSRSNAPAAPQNSK